MDAVGNFVHCYGSLPSSLVNIYFLRTVLCCQFPQLRIFTPSVENMCLGVLISLYVIYESSYYIVWLLIILLFKVCWHIVECQRQCQRQGTVYLLKECRVWPCKEKRLRSRILKHTKINIWKILHTHEDSHIDRSLKWKTVETNIQ
jgi:hypothetical protein